MEDTLKELCELNHLIKLLETKAEKLKENLKQEFSANLGPDAREFRQTFGHYEIHLWLKSTGKAVDEAAFETAHPYYAKQYKLIVKARKDFEIDKKPAVCIKASPVGGDLKITAQDVAFLAKAVGI
jgi:hypothetical protein